MAGLDANTKLLLHADGQSGSKEIIDDGNTGHVGTLVGTAQLTTAQSFFGSTSLFLDGNSDGVSFADSTDWDIFATTTEDWILEARIRHATGNPTLDNIIISQTNGATGWTFDLVSDESIRFRFFGAGSFSISSATGQINDTNFHHVMAVKKANVYALYLDGIQIAYQVNNNIATFGHTLNVGNGGNAFDFFNGNIDEARVQKSDTFGLSPNVGLTDTYTIPTSPHIPDANTKLLLHMDSHDVSGDGGSNSYHIPNFVGTAQIDTAESVFGGASLLLDGNSDYLSFPDSTDWDIFANNTDSWTIDYRVRYISFDSVQSPMSQYVNNSNRWVSQGVDRFRFVTGGSTEININPGGSYNNNQWYHVAIVVKGNGAQKEVGVYVDGTQVGYDTTSANATFSAPLFIGTQILGSNEFGGNIDELRIQRANDYNASPNVGLTDTITVPTSAYTLVAPPHGTPPTTGIDVDTKLMLHADSPISNNQEVIDSAGRHNTFTMVGTAQLSTAEKKWGSTSLFLDGNSDWVREENDSSDASLFSGTATYTISAWIYPTTLKNGSICSQFEGFGNYWSFEIFADGSIGVILRTQNIFRVQEFSSAGVITANEWNHVSIIRNKVGTFDMDYGIYVNGVQVHFFNSSQNGELKFDGLSMGGNYFGRYFEGYIDELKIQHENFFNATPNVGLTDTISVQSIPWEDDINDKYLLHMDSHDVSALAGNGIFHIPDFIATARTDTTEKVFGDSSFIFDGNSDYITFPDSSEFDMFADNSDDWILDFRVKLNGDYQDQYFINQVFNNDERWYFGNFQLGGAGTEVLQLAVRTGASFVILAESASGTGISDDNWHHVLICKKGSEYGFYLDGTQMFYINDSSIANINAPLQIGQNGFNTQYLDGRLDEFRIQCANDYSLNPNVGLTDSFTPPTQAYSYKPGKPINLVATSVAKDQIDLTWTPPNGFVQGYKIERENPIGGGFTTIVANTGSTSASYSDTGLVPITHYNYRVTAIFDSIESDPSDEADDWTQRFIWSGTKLYCPWDSDFNDIGPQTRTFFPYWNLPSILSGSDPAEIGDGLLRIDSGLGHHDSIATNNISDLDPFGNSTDEYTISFQVEHRDPPGTAIREIYIRQNPIGVSGSDWDMEYDTGGNVQLNIRVSGGGTLQIKSTAGLLTSDDTPYDVVFYKGKNGLGAWYINGVQASYHTNVAVNVPINVTHTAPFVVGTADGDGGNPGFKGRMDELIIAKGNIYGAKPDVGLTNTIVVRGELVPSEPTTFSAIKFDQTQIDLSWSAPLCDFGNTITGYRIERESPTGGGFTVLVADTGNTNTTYSDTGLAPDTQYNYRVSAINSVGTCNFSNESSATTTLDEDGIRWNKFKAEHEHVDPTKDWTLNKFNGDHCKNYDKL